MLLFGTDVIDVIILWCCLNSLLRHAQTDGWLDGQHWAAFICSRDFARDC